MMQQALPRPIPAFIPGDIRRRLFGQRTTLHRLPEQIRRRMRSPEKIKVSDHAAQYRMVTDGPHIGPWRHELSPHTVKIMNTYGLPHVRAIWFCGVDQSGKTNTMLNCLHWAADVDPGDIFYLMPTEDTAAKVTSEKLIPLIRQSKRLRQQVGNKENDTTLARIKLKHGVTIRPAWSNSAASMATYPAKHCFGDEVDKYPERTGRGASPIKMIEKRNRLYRGRYKRFFASTPEQLYIYKGTMACRQVWEMRHRCPHCHELFRPTGECLNLPEGLTADDIGPETDITYNCTECGSAITEEQRLAHLLVPEWVAIKGGELLRPSTVGFHHRAWDCRDVPLYEIAAAWLAAKNGGLADKIGWANGYARQKITNTRPRTAKRTSSSACAMRLRPARWCRATPAISPLSPTPSRSAFTTRCSPTGLARSCRWPRLSTAMWRPLPSSTTSQPAPGWMPMASSTGPGPGG